MQSTGQDSLITDPAEHEPMCASCTAAFPTRHCCTASMHRLRYVRPSVPHTKSFSVGHLVESKRSLIKWQRRWQFRFYLWLHSEPFARSHPCASSLIALMFPFVHVFFFISQELTYMTPSVPHTGSSSTPAGGHDRGQFDEIALLSLLDFSTTAGWVPGS